MTNFERYQFEILFGGDVNDKVLLNNNTLNSNFLKSRMLHMTTVNTNYPYGIIKKFAIAGEENKTHKGQYYFDVLTLKGERVNWWLTLKNGELNANLRLVSPDEAYDEFVKLIKK